MFDKFSEESIKVIMLAQEEARTLKHPHVGCEHLLLGLMATGEGPVYEVLNSNSLSLTSLRQSVESVHKKGKKASPKELPFDEDAKIALQRAFEEVKKANHEVIRPEHLFLGLNQPLSINKAGDALSTLGADRQALRLSVIYAMHGESSPVVADSSCMSQEDAVCLLRQCPQVLMFAMAEAYRLKQSQLGSELILLGLLGGGGTVIRVLEDFGITLETTREAIESRLSKGTGVINVDLPITPNAKELLKVASEKATQLGHDTLNARHLLLGFTHEQEGIAWQILKEKNVDIEALRAAVLALFEESK